MYVIISIGYLLGVEKMKKVTSKTIATILSSILLFSCAQNSTPTEPTHHFSNEWSSDETYHWHACTDEGCTEVSDKETHNFTTNVVEPTYATKGYTHHECTVCHYSFNDNYIDELVHHYSSTYSHDETHHWKACTDEGYENEKTDYGEHSFDTTVVDPTYTTKGYTHHECSVCHYSYNDTYVDELVHHYSSTYDHDSTHHWRPCTDSGYENEKTDYGEHSWGNWIIDEEATKEKDGLRHHICLTCGYSSTSESYPYASTSSAERVYLASSATELFTGNSYTINPVVIPEEAYHNVKYEIEDTTVISVSNNVASGLKQGTTLVYVYNDENDNDTRDSDEAFGVMAFSIKDGDPSISLEIDDSDLSMSVGDTKKLTYNVTGATPSGLDYGFYSDNEEVCTISAGNVKAHKAGKANISVTWQGYRDTVEITVNDLVDEKGTRASGIEFTDKSIVMTKGQNKQLSYRIVPSNAVDTIKSFTSNNEESVTVDNNGQLSAIKGGSAIITLTTENGKSNRILVTVKDETETYDSCYNNYYGNLTWENGEDLKAKLHDIISKDVTPLKYDAPNWETNQYADQDLYDHASVDVVYSNSTVLKSETNTGWQREHGFAASLMTGYSTGVAVKSLGRATDFHNLFASNSGANGSRGNKNLGYANPDSAEYTTKEECSYVKKAFEPGDNDKGRLARAIFYMGVMYNEKENVDIPESWTYRGDDTSTHSGASKTLHINSSELPLQIVEPNVDYNRISLTEFMYPNKTENVEIVNYYRSLIDLQDEDLKDDDYDLYRQKAYELYLNTAMPYSIGYLSDLLKWNSYSVDLLEMQHNDSVYNHNSSQGLGTQGNRNPFVDYPQLVDYVYGDLKDQPGSLDKLIPSYISLEMNKDEIHHYAYDSSENIKFEVGEQVDKTKFHLKAIKNNLSEGTVVYSKISVPSYTFVEGDIANGKDITVTTDKNTLVVHVSVVPSGGGASTIDECSWNYIPTSGNKNDYSESGATYVATFGDKVFDVTFANSSAGITNKNTEPAGVKIGTASAAAGTITIISRDSFTDVNAVFFVAGAASSKTYTYKIYVNDVEQLSGSFSGTSIVSNGGSINPGVTGKVKIVISDISAAINLCGFGINTAN